MRKTISEMQDQLLRKMEKDRGKAVTIKTPTLKEQLEALDAHEKLSPREKLAKMSWRDWTDELTKKLTTEYNICGNRHATSIIHFKHKSTFEKFHEEGKSFFEISQYVEKELPDNSF